MDRCSVAIALLLTLAAPPFAQTAFAQTTQAAIEPPELSRRITAIAADLFAAERKTADRWRQAENEAEPDGETGGRVDSVLYEDVMRMLDSAVEVDPDNMHAHELLAEVLLRKAYDGDGTYDVCSLLDARDEAEWVVSHAVLANAADLRNARTVLKSIKAIPKSAIPDDPSTCGDEPKSGSSTVKLRG